MYFLTSALDVILFYQIYGLFNSSMETYVVGIHKKHDAVALLISTLNICFVEKQEEYLDKIHICMNFEHIIWEMGDTLIIR